MPEPVKLVDHRHRPALWLHQSRELFRELFRVISDSLELVVRLLVELPEHVVRVRGPRRGLHGLAL